MNKGQWVLVIAAVLGVAAMVWMRSPNGTVINESLPSADGEIVSSSTASHELFLATRKDAYTAAIGFYNTETQTTDAEADLVSPDPVVSIQFDSITQQVVYETGGREVIGDACLNADGSCNRRLYLSDGPTSQPVVLFDTDSELNQWVLDAVDGVVLLTAFSKEEGETFKKIDLQNKSVVYSVPFVSLGTAGTFSLSADHQSVYRTVTVETSGVTTIKVQTFNVATGEMREKQIYQGKDQIEASWTPVSPDGKHLAIWVGLQGSEAAYLYDVASLSYRIVTPKARVRNYRIVWSGDSTSFVLLEDEASERIDAQTLASMIVDPSPTYIFDWNDSADRILAHIADGNSPTVINLVDGTSYALPVTLAGADHVLGTLFFPAIQQ